MGLGGKIKMWDRLARLRTEIWTWYIPKTKKEYLPGRQGLPFLLIYIWVRISYNWRISNSELFYSLKSHVQMCYLWLRDTSGHTYVSIPDFDFTNIYEYQYFRKITNLLFVDSLFRWPIWASANIVCYSSRNLKTTPYQKFPLFNRPAVSVQ